MAIQLPQRNHRPARLPLLFSWPIGLPLCELRLDDKNIYGEISYEAQDRKAQQFASCSNCHSGLGVFVCAKLASRECLMLATKRTAPRNLERLLFNAQDVSQTAPMRRQ
jgi:hypothetical protein